MNSIGMFGNIMNLYSSFINSYYPLQNINSREIHQLKFIFMNFISLVMNCFYLILNDYDNYNELVWF